MSSYPVVSCRILGIIAYPYEFSYEYSYEYETWVHHIPPPVTSQAGKSSITVRVPAVGRRTVQYRTVAVASKNILRTGTSTYGRIEPHTSTSTRIRAGYSYEYCTASTVLPNPAIFSSFFVRF